MALSLIPDWLSTLIAFGSGAAFFTALGLPLSRAVMPHGVTPLAAAPILGWAVFCVVGLPLLSLTGFGALPIRLYALVCLGCAGLMWRRLPHSGAPALPRWVPVLAGLCAWLPAMAIMPKRVDGGILLAPPMFDHVKIAVVDAILRNGLPVSNPFYGPGGNGQLAYYYLWHFGTAVMASALHIGGWGAEAAMTAFTAFASLMLMMGLVATLGGGALGGVAVALLSLPGSMRLVLAALIGADHADGVVPRSSDIGGWLNQAAWVPQHLSSACCVIVAGLLMLRIAEAGNVVVAAVLGLVVAGGFESSIWIGGIGFAVAGAALSALLLWQRARDQRIVFLAWGMGAAAVAAVLILPFAAAELHSVGARGGSAGLSLTPYAVLGRAVPVWCRRVLDVPAFWLLLLPFEFPAILPLGLVAVTRPGSLGLGREQCRILQVLAVLAGGFLVVAWLLRSTIDNNDLGWRAALPAVLALTVCAACALRLGVVWGSGLKPTLRLVGVIGLLMLGTPDAIRMIREYKAGQLPGDAAGFGRAENLWPAVQLYASGTDRVGSNPHAVAAATPWPVNIGWALLSDRPSCFSGWATVIAYGAIPERFLLDINARFARLFDGTAQPGDVQILAGQYDCAVIALSKDDGAWSHDPFATSAEYRLMQAGDSWRIYKRR